MVQKLLKRSEFARFCGVSPSAVTKAAANLLEPALVGRRIDAAHPAALEYLKNKMSAPTAVGHDIDPLYQRAVDLCRQSGKCSVKFLKGALSIGHPRAKALVDAIRSSGTPGDSEGGFVPTAAAVVESTPISEKPHARGHVAAREKKKTESTPIEMDLMPEHLSEFIDMPLGELIKRFGTDIRFLDWLRARQLIESVQEKQIKNALAAGELIHRNLVKIGIVEPVDTALKKLLTDGARTISQRTAAMHDAGRSVEDVEHFVRDQISSHIRPMKAVMSRALQSAERR